MPFVREEYTITQPLKAFVFLVRVLHLSPNAAQRLIDKGRIFTMSKMKAPITKP